MFLSPEPTSRLTQYGVVPMKLLIEAVQTVTVELLGVLLVVATLFGCASFGLRAAAGENQEWTATLESWTARASAILPSPPPVAERADYVARRLDHYGFLLGDVSQDLWHSTWK
jgi:hypothetical protein